MTDWSKIVCGDDWKFRRKVTPLFSFQRDPLFRLKVTPWS